MTEFDFDELDKAVNSLMKDPSLPAQNSTTNTSHTSKPVDQSDDSPRDEMSVAPSSHNDIQSESPAPALTTLELTNQSSMSAPHTITGISAPAVKRSGRFMDVVHPSSDMTKPGTAERPTPRHGLTLEPQKPSLGTEPESQVNTPSQNNDLSPDEQEMSRRNGAALSSKHMTIEPLSAHGRIGEVIEPDTMDDHVELANSETNDNQSYGSNDSLQSVESQWPEQPSEDVTTNSSDANEDVDTKSLLQPTDNNTEPITPVITSSPFIANAHVEKRPLGGVTQETDQSKTETSDTDEPILTEDDTKLPDELSGAMLGIESDETNPMMVHQEESDDERVAESSQNADVTSSASEDVHPTVEPYNSDDTTSNQPPAPQDNNVGRPSSRTVTNAVDTTDQSSPVNSDSAEDTSTFDTSVYHQPLAHADEKKTHWLLVVVAIIGLMVLGGAAAAYFYLQNQGFDFSQFI